MPFNNERGEENMAKPEPSRLAPKLLAFALAASLLAGCSYRGGHTNYTVTPLKGNTALQAAAKAYFSMPEDYVNGQERTERSGAETRQALQKGLAKQSGERIFAPTPQPRDQALAAARAAGCAYLVSPEILAWEDPPAILDRSDRGEVMLRVYDVASGELLRMDNVSCSGSATRINQIGAYSPGDCLEPAFTQWGLRVFTKN